MTPSAQHAGGGIDTTTAARDHITERIRRWHALYGEAPSTADWNPSVARWRAQEWRVARYAAGDPETGEAWPSLSAVKRRFGGSFDAAVRAAGLEPRRPGVRAAAGAPVRRPAVAPRDAGADLAAATARARAAEARAAAAERRLRDAERLVRRAERRADTDARRLEDARVRARRAQDRARGLRAARERAEERLALELRAARAEAAAQLAEADARVRAAEDRAAAAVEDASRARALAMRTIRTHAPAPVHAGGHPGGNGNGGGHGHAAARPTAPVPPGGPGPFTAALRSVAAARHDRVRLHAALTALAEAAVAWRDRL